MTASFNVTPMADSEAARTSRRLYPSHSWCIRCGMPWAIVEGHIVYPKGYPGRGAFACCTQCWPLMTPDERVEAIGKLVAEWRKMAPQSEDDKAYAGALLIEASRPEPTKDPEGTMTVVSMVIEGLPRKEFRRHKRLVWWSRWLPFLKRRVRHGLIMEAGTTATFSANVKVDGGDWHAISQHVGVLQGRARYGLRTTEDGKFIQVYIDNLHLEAKT